MNGVCILDTALVCALGSSLEEVWPRLCRGESAIGPIGDFDTDQLDYHNAACVSVGAKDPSRAHRHTVEPNRICALMHLALEQLDPVPVDTAVIWAGVKGNVEYVQRCAEKGLSEEPEDRALPEIHHPRGYRKWVCQVLGIKDRGLEVNAACASSTVALALGMQMIAHRECAHVLVCAADIVSRFTFTGFAALKALSPTTCRPFDLQRDGLVLGDGAAAMLLADPAVVSASEETGHASARMPAQGSSCSSGVDRPHVRLTGWGISNDANHITGPSRDGSGLSNAIRQALLGAGISFADVAGWCTHGTGTIYNDAMELAALTSLHRLKTGATRARGLQAAARGRLPIFSIKGAVGHTLGAAGVLEAAVCVKALQEKMIPPTAGLREPEPRALGRAIDECQALPGNRVLTTNSGFGGVNAALVLELPERAPM